MKKYILTGIALLVVSATASGNPFDLKENFGKLEQEQGTLLTELKKIAEIKELAMEQELEDTDEVKNEKGERELPRKDLPTIEIDDIVTSSDNQVDVLAPSMEEYNNQGVVAKDIVQPSEHKLNEIRQKALEASKKEALQKVVQAKKVELKKEKKDALKILEAKKEAEKREVEAYEKERAKKRAERLARKAAEAVALEKEALAQKVEKEKFLAEQKAKKNLKTQEKVVNKVKVPVKQNSITKKSITQRPKKIVVEKNIDAKREKQEAKIAADKAYEEAVKEMSKEEEISSS